MYGSRITYLILIMITTTSIAQTDKTQFTLLRQNDAIKQFSDKKNNLYSKLKYIEITDGLILSPGGSYRFQWEVLDNPRFQKESVPDNNWFLSRGLFHIDVRSNKWQLFSELGTSHSINKEIPTPVDDDRLYINQLFFIYDNGNYEIAIGRENFNYGSRRLIAIREGPNVRLSFDAIRFTYRWKNFSSEALLLSNVANEIGVLDNNFYAFDNYIWGNYNRYKSKSLNAELYYLGYSAEVENFEAASGQETRHSLGLRTDLSIAKWKFNNEFVYQFGTIGVQNINAWTLSVSGKYPISDSLDYEFNTEVISGDTNPTDGTLNTFNPLYPDAAYFGRVARFGPYNLIDVHTNITYHTKKLSTELGYYAFWRYSNTDAIYSSGGRVTYPSVNDEKFVAHQVGFNFKYNWNAFFETDIESNIILPGDFLKRENFNDNIYYLILTSKFTF